jgi:biopolymer transport protein ExbD
MTSVNNFSNLFANSIKKSGAAAINITSLIDVIFLLVVFFMVGSTFDKPAFLVELPKAVSGERVEWRGISIAVDAGGNAWIDGERVENAALSQKIQALSNGKEDVSVSLDCDGRADFQSIALVMDAVKSAGVRRLAMRHDAAR